jgi:tetratricopeptide (TPR) repeat protein
MRLRRVLGMAIVGSIAAVAWQASDAQRYFDRARQLFERQGWDEAQEAATKALAADPRMGDAEMLLGLIATVRSQFAEAEKHFVRAVALQPENYQAHAYLGSTYLQQKRLPEAAAAFRKVLELNPHNVAAGYNLGLIELEQNSPAEALRHFEAVARANPSDVPTAIGKLESLLLLHKNLAAQKTAQQLQALLTDNDPRLFQVATLLARHGDPAAAVPLMERARRAFPESYDASYNLALACLQAEQYNRAAEVLQFFTGEQGKAEAFNLLGTVEEKRGRFGEAESAFEEAARRDSANEDYRFDYGNSLAQHGKLEPALAVFQAAVADLPKSWKLRLGLGSVSYLRGDYESSAEVLLDAVKLKPDDVPAYFLLGEVYDSAQRFQPAIETAFTTYLKTSPRDPWAYYHHAAMLYERAQTGGNNDYRVALANLDEALRLNANFAEAHFQQGLIAVAQGQTEQGITSLEKSVRLDPKLAAAHYRLGLAYQRLGEAQRAKAELDRFRTLKNEERYRGRVLESLSSIGR